VLRGVAVVVEHAAVAVVVERVAVAVEEVQQQQQLFEEEQLGFGEEEAQEVDFPRDALLLQVAGERQQGNRHQTS